MANTFNNTIKKLVCTKTINSLKDDNLYYDFQNHGQNKQKLLKLSSILENNGVKGTSKEKVLNEYLLGMISKGTREGIRLDKFKTLVAEAIKEYELDESEYTIDRKSTRLNSSHT